MSRTTAGASVTATAINDYVVQQKTSEQRNQYRPTEKNVTK